jgi:hypothetical protein
MAVQLQRAMRIEYWLLSTSCPTQQRKNRHTWLMSWKLEKQPVLGGGGAAQHKDYNNSISLKILNELQRELSQKTERVITLADICRLPVQYNVCKKLSNL